MADPLLPIEGIGRVLVIAPHADDEVLGAGGLLAKVHDAGATARVLFIAVDGFHHYGRERDTMLEERLSEIRHVSEFLGFEYRTVFEGRDLIERLDTVPQRELVDVFEQEYNTFRPDLLLLPHGIDFDQDHRACYRAAFAAARPIPESLGKHFPQRVATYEFPKLAWTERPFRPSLFFDVSREIERKLEAIRLYATVLRDPPDVRSPENVRHLAYLRGSEIGVPYAEAFHVLRWVCRPPGFGCKK